VIAKRTRAKNSVRTLLRCAGVVPPSRPALWTKKGLEWLRPLELPAESQRLRRDLLLEEVEALSRQAERIEVHLNQRAKNSPAVLLLRSIPGVGVRTAKAVAAFIDDPDRFRDAKAIGRYFGLVPSQDQSGPRNRLGHITREGPPVVRQLVGEAAWQALRRSPTVRAYFGVPIVTEKKTTIFTVTYVQRADGAVTAPRPLHPDRHDQARSNGRVRANERPPATVLKRREA
jgi:transposase